MSIEIKKPLMHECCKKTFKYTLEEVADGIENLEFNSLEDVSKCLRYAIKMLGNN